MSTRVWAGLAAILVVTGCVVQPPPEQPMVQGQATAGGQVAAQPVYQQPQQQQVVYQQQQPVYQQQPVASATYAGPQAQPVYQQQPVASATYVGPQAQPVYVTQTDYGNDYVGQHMSMRAQQFAAGLIAASPLRRGALSQGQEERFQATLNAGNCYRVIGVGGQGISDLDLFIIDQNGNAIAQDTATDNFPVLGLGSDMVCPQWTGTFYIRALAYSGSGDYGLQLFAQH